MIFKKYSLLSITVLFYVVSYTLSAQNPSMFTYPENGFYYIESSLGKNLDVQWANKEVGTPLHLWPYNGKEAQKFLIKKVDENYYTIQSQLGTYVSLAQNSSEAEIPIVMLNNPNSAQAHWQFRNSSDGQIFIKNKKGNYLALKDGSGRDGTLIWTTKSIGRNTTKWKLINANENPQGILMTNVNLARVSSTIQPKVFNDNIDEELVDKIRELQERRKAQESERNTILSARLPYLNKNVYVEGLYEQNSKNNYFKIHAQTMIKSIPYPTSGDRNNRWIVEYASPRNTNENLVLTVRPNTNKDCLVKIAFDDIEFKHSSRSVRDYPEAYINTPTILVTIYEHSLSSYPKTWENASEGQKVSTNIIPLGNRSNDYSFVLPYKSNKEYMVLVKSSLNFNTALKPGSPDKFDDFTIDHSFKIKTISVIETHTR